VRELLSSIADMQFREGSAELNADQIQDSDEESSAYNFAPEYSVHIDDEDNSKEEISTHEYTVQKLYNQLQGGHHDCPEKI
jgi:hypothetical protein